MKQRTYPREIWLIHSCLRKSYPLYKKPMSISSIHLPSIPHSGVANPVSQPLIPTAQGPSLALTQVQQDFSAALRRASRRGAIDGDTSCDGEEERAGAVAQMPQLPTPVATPAAADALQSSANIPTTPTPTTALPDAVPLTGPQHAIGNERQWRMNIPLDHQAKATLAMRVVHTNTGHWQMRLATDQRTRQQLTPHLDRLRDTLQQRSQGQLSDVGFDEDTSANDV